MTKFAAFGLSCTLLAGGYAHAQSPAVENPATAAIATPPTDGTTAGGAPLRLSLADALALANEHSPLLSGSQARISAAQARLKSARALASPTLALAHAFGKNTGGFDEDVILSQTLEIGKRGSRVAGARAERNAAEAERSATGTELAFDVQSAYFEALRADVERDLAADVLKTAQTFSQAAQTQFEAGDAPRSNVVRAGIETSRAEQALDAAQSERANRYATLRSLTALPDATPLILTDTLAFTPATYDLNILHELALNSRADLQAARLLRQARQSAVSNARAQNRPDVFIEARRAAIVPYRDTPNGQSLRFGLTLPVFDLGRNKSSVREAQAAVQEQQASLDETTRTAHLEVQTALQTFQAVQKAVQSFDAGRLARSRELLDMAQIGYERGATSYLELLDAQQVYRNEQTDYARALAAWNTARVALERAVGGKLP